MLRKMMVLSVLIAACVLLFAVSVSQAAVIDEGLRQLMAQKSVDEMYPVLMIYHDLPDWEEDLIQGEDELDKKKRRKKIISELKKKTKQVQESAVVLLDRPGSRDRCANIRQLYLANAISFDANRDVVEALGALDVNATLFHDRTYDLTTATRRGEMRATTSAFPSAGEKSAAATDTVWSVKYINADRVWNELGYTGAGVVVGHIDSGVWMTHPDLVNRFWVNPGEIPGNGVDDDANGYIDDVNGWDFGVGDNDPNDDSPSSGHGTHTAGTVVGDGSGGTLTGVAPGASLMALKVWQADGTGGTLSMIWAAEQYAAENGARVITMSLGIPGEIPDAYLRNDRFNFNNLRDLGVLMFNSAGNEHNSYDPPIECSMTARVPSPWSWTGELFSHTGGVVSVGGTGYKNDAMYNSSSRGPVTWQTVDPWGDYPYDPGTGLIKPDVSAPGVGVNSTIIPSGYSGDSWSGTSMACPHVAGLAALMLEKNPTLSPAGLDSLMQLNSIDLGSAGKDNDYGAGRIDAYDIVQAVPELPLSDLVYTDVLPDCTGDKVLDPGETAAVAFGIRNASPVQAATSITGSLAVVSNPYVTISDAAGSFPDLPIGGGVGDNTGDPFALTIDPAAPQGYEFTLLLTLTTAAGFERTFDIPWYVGLPDYRTHNVGSTYLTVTDQGSIGYMSDSGTAGSGLGHLDEMSSMYIGSLWIASNVYYVCNRDYGGNGAETFEWEVVDDPNGRVRDHGAVNSDQTYSAIFSDSGHDAPKPLVVRQSSFVFSSEPNDDFVILEYDITNEGPDELSTLYAGVFCDLDIGDSGANEGAVDPARNLTYMYEAGGAYWGIALIGGTAHNLTLISNSDYVYPLLHVEDGFKLRFLSGLISTTVSDAPNDWSALTSASIPLAANGGSTTVTFALVYGESLADLQANVDAANAAYDPFSPVTDEAPVKVVRLDQNHPNPFNPSTTIQYSVARDGHVDLAVYDLSGRRIKTLVSETRGAGDYSVSWDGSDDAGARVPSGMYFYRYVSGAESVARKMTLIK